MSTMHHRRRYPNRAKPGTVATAVTDRKDKAVKCTHDDVERYVLPNGQRRCRACKRAYDAARYVAQGAKK